MLNCIGRSHEFNFDCDHQLKEIKCEKLERHKNYGKTPDWFWNCNVSTCYCFHLDFYWDDHHCAFGKWLYGPEREAAQSLMPSLTALFKSIEEPHMHLHKSAAEIKEVFIQADNGLPAKISQREIEHLYWAAGSFHPKVRVSTT